MTHKIKKRKKQLQPLTLVKWNYDNMPEFWKKDNPNPHIKTTFVYFGEIPNMLGHAYVQCVKTGKPQVFHTVDLIPLTEEEL